MHETHAVRVCFVCNDGPLYRLAVSLVELIASCETDSTRLAIERIRCRRQLSVGPVVLQGRLFRKSVEAGVAVQLLWRGLPDVLLAGGERWPFAYVRAMRYKVKTVELEDGLRTLLDVQQPGANKRYFFGALFSLQSFASLGEAHHYQHLRERLSRQGALNKHCQHSAFDAQIWIFGTPMAMVYCMPKGAENVLYEQLADALRVEYPSATVAFFPHPRQSVDQAKLARATGWNVHASPFPKELAILACGKQPEAIVGFYSTLTLYVPQISRKVRSHAVFIAAQADERQPVVGVVNQKIAAGLKDLNQLGPHWVADASGQLSQLEHWISGTPEHAAFELACAA